MLNNDIDACKGDLLLTKLLPAFRDIVALYLNRKKQTVHDQLHELIRLEKHDPYTMNHYYINKIDDYKAHLAKQKANNTAEKRSSTSKIEDDEFLLDSISNDDITVQEMIISIYSYWKVLTKRFSDYTALSLRAGCVFDICLGIRERLRHVPTEQCDFVDSYLAEDAHVRAKRKQLQQTKERLEKVDAILGGHSIASVANNTSMDFMPMENDSLMTLDALARKLADSSVHGNTGNDLAKTTPTSTTGILDKTIRK